MLMSEAAPFRFPAQAAHRRVLGSPERRRCVGSCSKALSPLHSDEACEAARVHPGLSRRAISPSAIEGRI